LSPEETIEQLRAEIAAKQRELAAALRAAEMGADLETKLHNECQAHERTKRELAEAKAESLKQRYKCLDLYNERFTVEEIKKWLEGHYLCDIDGNVVGAMGLEYVISNLEDEQDGIQVWRERMRAYHEGDDNES
jgi:hypothetical protein